MASESFDGKPILSEPQCTHVPVADYALYNNYRSHGIVVPQIVEFAQAKNGKSFQEAIEMVKARGHRVQRSPEGIEVEELPENGIFHLVHDIAAYLDMPNRIDSEIMQSVKDVTIARLRQKYQMTRKQLEAVFRPSRKAIALRENWLKEKGRIKKRREGASEVASVHA